ncbi:MAG: hypothetical protein ACRD2O_06355 [Terriglobia bacterium]
MLLKTKQVSCKPGVESHRPCGSRRFAPPSSLSGEEKDVIFENEAGKLLNTKDQPSKDRKNEPEDGLKSASSSSQLIEEKHDN